MGPFQREGHCRMTASGWLYGKPEKRNLLVHFGLWTSANKTIAGQQSLTCLIWLRSEMTSHRSGSRSAQDQMSLETEDEPSRDNTQVVHGGKGREGCSVGVFGTSVERDRQWSDDSGEEEDWVRIESGR